METQVFENNRILADMQAEMPAAAVSAINNSSWAREGRELADVIRCIELDVDDLGLNGLPEGLTLGDMRQAGAIRRRHMTYVPTAQSHRSSWWEEHQERQRQRELAEENLAARQELWDIHSRHSIAGISEPAAVMVDRPDPDGGTMMVPVVAAELAAMTTEQIRELSRRLDARLAAGERGIDAVAIGLELLAPAPEPAPALVNLTEHSVTIHGNGAPVTLPPSGGVARVSTTETPVETLPSGITLSRSQAGEVTGLPDQAPGVILVVSAMVRLALPHRTDLASPGQLVRDERGQPIGCRGLVVN